MAESTVSVTESLQQFIDLLRQQLPQIEAIYLYGSRARGTATEWSDIDVAVVSPAFAPDLFQGYRSEVWGTYSGVEPLGAMPFS